jgi:hypothetical protein
MARPARKSAARLTATAASRSLSDRNTVRRPRLENSSLESEQTALVESPLEAQLRTQKESESFAALEKSLEHKARVRREDEEWELRKKAAERLLLVFLIANGISLAALVAAWWTDNANMGADKTYVDHRIFDKDVMMALLAATTVQLGTVAVIISNWLFPKNRR